MCRRNAIHPAVVERAVAHQKVHRSELVELSCYQTEIHPGPVDSGCSQIKIRSDRVVAGSLCFQTIHRMTVQVAGYFQTTILRPVAAESGHYRTETHQLPAAAVVVEAGRKEMYRSAFL